LAGVRAPFSVGLTGFYGLRMMNCSLAAGAKRKPRARTPRSRVSTCAETPNAFVRAVYVMEQNYQITAHNLQIMEYNFQIAGYNFQIMKQDFQIAGYNFQIVRQDFQITERNLKIACHNL
jgi:hypothetical protein